MKRRAVLLVLLASSLPAAASADRVPPPPSECPTGSWGHTEHAGQWCVPVECASDADCDRTIPRDFSPPEGARFSCVETALCVVEESYRQGGNLLDPPLVTRRVARASCAPSAPECVGATSCQRARRCVLATEAARAEAARAEAPSTPTPSEPGAVDPPASTETSSTETSSSEGASPRSGGCSASGGTRRGPGFAALALMAGLGLRRRALVVARAVR